MKRCLASSFADPADIAAFQAAKSRGLSDLEAFKFGDNGVGKWGDSTCDPLRPACALPPEDWKSLGDLACGTLVKVFCGNRQVICELLDTMPRRANIRNGAGIDLNPAACEALGLMPPVLVSVSWRFASSTDFLKKESKSFLSRLLTKFIQSLFK